MNGIAGKITLSLDHGMPRAVVHAMTDALVCRGPDACGYYFAPGVALGWRHRQASGGPVSPNPVATEDGSVRAVGDCAITNGRELRAELKALGHRFCGLSPVEAIVHGYEEWGDGVVLRLKGAFAFAVWDERRMRLLFARDRLGVRPLYYHALEDGVVFASEMKALLEDPDVPRDCDLDAINQYVTLRYVPSPRTILQAVRKLAAGHYAVTDAAGTVVREYWDLPWWDEREGRRERDYLDAASATLREAVRAESRGGEAAPLLLSGGVASAALGATIADVRQAPLVTVGAGFDRPPFTGVDGSRRVAKQLRARHFTEVVTPELDELVPRLAWYLDEPLGDPSALFAYYLAASARRHGSTAIAAYGGHHAWGGLHRHHVERRQRLMRRFLGPFRLEAALAGAVLPRTVPGSETFRHLARSPVHSAVCRHAEDAPIHLLSRDFLRETRDLDPLEPLRGMYDGWPSPDPLARVLYLDVRMALPDNLLTIVDRTSAAASVDLRLPLLDSNVVALAAVVPTAIRLRGNRGSFVLRQLAQRRVPETQLVIGAGDAGSRLAGWLRGPLAPMVSDLVLSGRFRQRGLFAPKAVTRLWQEHLTGRADHRRALWSLLMLELWLRQFADGARRLERAA